jgi:hypothetical protein
MQHRGRQPIRMLSVKEGIRALFGSKSQWKLRWCTVRGAELLVFVSAQDSVPRHVINLCVDADVRQVYADDARVMSERCIDVAGNREDLTFMFEVAPRVAKPWGCKHG